ncbi:transcriptional regulator, GntR family protein [Gordonia neofelifaecis NRRL B-59395]|uniref:Transcriptional regulator, GntR family protein n=2 Tax=Gordonia TaxID=2053 RepID=F1YGM3_9ACTN|nr:transcriptional regulator, GntR family protein [Gordonia neofelifaecis NRRL B-59395]
MRAPSEAELCAEFGVSRGPVRQAMASLRTDGLLVGGQGSRPLVRRNVPEHSATVLGSFTAWADGQGHRPGQRTLLQSRHPADAELAGRLDIAAGEPVLTIVRVRTLDDEPALIERMSFVWEVGQTLMEFDPDSGSINRFMIDHGVDLYSSDHLLDAVAAGPEDADALGVDEGSPLLRVRRRTQDSVGRIIESAEDRYLPGHCSISITNRLTAASGRQGTMRLA